MGVCTVPVQILLLLLYNLRQESGPLVTVVKPGSVDHLEVASVFIEVRGYTFKLPSVLVEVHGGSVHAPALGGPPDSVIKGELAEGGAGVEEEEGQHYLPHCLYLNHTTGFTSWVDGGILLSPAVTRIKSFIKQRN